MFGFVLILFGELLTRGTCFEFGGRTLFTLKSNLINKASYSCICFPPIFFSEFCFS